MDQYEINALQELQYMKQLRNNHAKTLDQLDAMERMINDKKKNNKN